MRKKIKIISIIIFLLSGITGIKAQDNVLIRISTSKELEPFTEGYINSSGDTIIPIGKYIYCFTEKFDKIAFVGIKGLPGFYAIDRNENILFRIHTYDNGPDPLNDGLFRIIKNNKTGFANMDGQIIIQPQFDFALPFRDSFAVVCVGGRDEKDGEYSMRVGGKWGLINTSGKEILEPAYDDIQILEDGKIRVKKDGEWEIR